MSKNLRSATISARLTALADRLADKIAITEGEANVRYAELDAAATAIARRLVAVGGVRPGFVCLLFQSKITAIEAMFGASRAARAYVSLDAGDPDQRLRFILQDSQPIALLTEGALLQRAGALAGAACDVIDVGALDRGREAEPFPLAPLDATAYVVYTSGSTGTPKGVTQTQNNLLYFADAYARALEITETDRLSLVFSLSFGASNLHIFAGLLNGATLCAYDIRRSGAAAMADWLDRERVNVLHTVPSLFRELMNALAPGRKLANLRAIDLAGEAMFYSDVGLFRARTPEGCRLVNQLGATEASIIAQYLVPIERRAGASASGIVPVGRSPAGLRVMIRRDDGSPAEPNEIGEIVVCSSHLSPGYWRRPELNASTFEAGPGDERRYLTRDLGRIDDDDNLHFLGRRGSRVKVRGYSVDLTEVEAALCACPGVSKAAVLAAGSGPQREAARLAAFVVATADGDRDPARVRRCLSQRLPAYMLPTLLAFLDVFPLTSSGKIDRAALAALEPQRQREPEPPRDPIEKTVARLFGEVLSQSPVARHDDFFLLGGDSLSVVELQTRLRDAFGASLASIYDDPTVSGIAAQIRNCGATVLASGLQRLPILFPLRERGSAPPLFLVHGRLGQALVSPHFLQLLGDDQPVWAFQARGLDGLEDPHSTIEAMAAHYLAAMRGRRPQGPYFIGALCAGALIAIEMAHMLEDAGETVLPLLLLDPPERPFAMEDAAMTEERLLARLKNKQARGTVAAPLDDPVYARASVRVARAMERAIRTHRPRPYYGAVCMLSSHGRIAESTAPTGLYAGKIDRYEVAATHREILDTHNELFAKQLSHCLEEIRRAA